jgi:hypothetical protein
VSYQLTKKEIIKEVVKSGRDPVYFIRNYCKISHPMRGLIPFETYEFQDELLREFNDHRFNVILKARQLGISTVTAAYIAWMMIFHRDKNILVVATKFGTASNLVKKVKQIIKHLPSWVRISDVSIDNRTSFELSNGSQIKASSTSGDAGRSEALSLLVIDEAAHVEGLAELWTGLYPTLSTGGRCIALSTPNGVGNWFHQICSDAEHGANDFNLTVLPWDVHPDRDKEWFDNETKNMSRRQIAQELECNFNMSGETVLHPEDIEWLSSAVYEPDYKTGFDRGLWMWERYNPEHKYLLVADVARGDGKDFSAFHVINLVTLEQVAEYQGKVDLDMFADLLDNTGREYGECMLVVENNNLGYAVLEKLQNLEYPNLYWSVKSTHEYLEPHIAEHRHGAVPGFTTSMKTRPLIVAKLEEFARNKLITVHSSRTLNEMKTFIWNNSKPEAMQGYNDDLVISLAIACWVRDTALITNQRAVEYGKALLGSMVSSNTVLDTKVAGQRGYKPASKSLEHQAKKMKEFGWLLKG